LHRTGATTDEAGGPLSFPLLFDADSEDDDQPPAADGADRSTAAAVGGIASAREWWVLAADVGELVLVGLVLLLGATLLVSGFVQLLP
jgi:hypothetical protein